MILFIHKLKKFNRVNERTRLPHLHILCSVTLLRLLLGGGGGGGGSEGLVGRGLLEGEGGESAGNGNAVLERVGDGVGDRGLGGEVGGEGELREHGDGGSDLEGEDVVGDVEDLGVEEGAVVIDHLEDKTVGEGGDVELLEEGGLGGSNLLSGGDEVGVVGHLDLSLGNLGGDLEGLEEGCLSGVASGGSGGDNDVAGGDSSDTGGGRADVVVDGGADVSEVSVGEDESDVSTAEDSHLGDGGVRVLLGKLPEDLAHHGVLAHEDLRLAAESDPGVLELLRANVVDIDNEGLGVGAEELLHLLEVLFFTFAGERHGE